MGEVAGRVSSGCNPFINLSQVHLVPGNILFSQGFKHDPGSVTTTHCEYEAIAFSYGRSRVTRDQLSRFLCDCLGICEYFNLHTGRELPQKNAKNEPQINADLRGFG